jgi:glyoxylate reductase
MSRPHIYVTRVIPRAGIEILQQSAAVEVNESDIPLTPEQLKQRAGTVHALVTLLTDEITREVLAAGTKLVVVANVAVGYNNIDVEAATELGIAITNTPGVLTDTTADFTWALLMAVARRVVEGDRYVRAGQFHGWGIELLLGADIHGATLGIVGMGRIGQAVARRAQGFDMTVLYYDEQRLSPEQEEELHARYVDLDTLLAESDFISLHTPLTPQTAHLISHDQLRRMKPTAYLINTSRGPVVDEAALAQALRQGAIAGAALDVFEQEPSVHPDLLELPNVVLTPHIASASTATRTRMATMAAENCLAALHGQYPPNIVNPGVLETDAHKQRLAYLSSSGGAPSDHKALG